jgi:hypothetical protein
LGSCWKVDAEEHGCGQEESEKHFNMIPVSYLLEMYAYI